MNIRLFHENGSGLFHKSGSRLFYKSGSRLFYKSRSGLFPSAALHMPLHYREVQR